MKIWDIFVDTLILVVCLVVLEVFCDLAVSTIVISVSVTSLFYFVSRLKQ